MAQVGPLEILTIFVVALVVFGPSKLPEIARQVGRGLRELRRLQKSLQRDLDDVLGDDEATAAPTPAPKRRNEAGDTNPATAATLTPSDRAE